MIARAAVHQDERRPAGGHVGKDRLTIWVLQNLAGRERPMFFPKSNDLKSGEGFTNSNNINKYKHMAKQFPSKALGTLSRIGALSPGSERSKLPLRALPLPLRALPLPLPLSKGEFLVNTAGGRNDKFETGTKKPLKAANQQYTMSFTNIQTSFTSIQVRSWL